MGILCMASVPVNILYMGDLCTFGCFVRHVRGRSQVLCLLQFFNDLRHSFRRRRRSFHFSWRTIRSLAAFSASRVLFLIMSLSFWTHERSPGHGLYSATPASSSDIDTSIPMISNLLNSACGVFTGMTSSELQELQRLHTLIYEPNTCECIFPLVSSWNSMLRHKRICFLLAQGETSSCDTGE